VRHNELRILSYVLNWIQEAAALLKEAADNDPEWRDYYAHQDERWHQRVAALLKPAPLPKGRE
jgi:hypothetical protein